MRPDPEHDTLIRGGISSSLPTDENGKQLTQRELGRLRSKRVLLAKMKQKQDTSQTPEADKVEGDDMNEGRETKKKNADESGNALMKNGYDG